MFDGFKIKFKVKPLTYGFTKKDVGTLYCTLVVT